LIIVHLIMRIDITKDFYFKTTEHNGVSITIKSVFLILGKINNIFLPRVEILSRHGNIYKLEDLIFNQ
jgi:hypothetical protein